MSTHMSAHMSTHTCTHMCTQMRQQSIGWWWCRCEAAVLALGLMATQLIDNQPVVQQLLKQLAAWAEPSHPHFLRGRAMWCAGRLAAAAVETSHDDTQLGRVLEPYMPFLVGGAAVISGEAELPVRICACKTVVSIIPSIEKRAFQFLVT